MLVDVHEAQVWVRTESPTEHTATIEVGDKASNPITARVVPLGGGAQWFLASKDGCPIASGISTGVFRAKRDAVDWIEALQPETWDRIFGWRRG